MSAIDELQAWVTAEFHRRATNVTGPEVLAKARELGITLDVPALRRALTEAARQRTGGPALPQPPREVEPDPWLLCNPELAACMGWDVARVVRCRIYSGDPPLRLTTHTEALTITEQGAVRPELVGEYLPGFDSQAVEAISFLCDFAQPDSNQVIARWGP